MTPVPSAFHPSKPASLRASSIQGLGFSAGLQFRGRTLFVGLAPRLQWFRHGIALRWYFEEHRNIDTQSNRQPVEQVHGCIVFTALDAADGGAINPGIHGKIFLRELSSGPHLADIPCNARAGFHASMAIILSARNPWNIFDLIALARRIHSQPPEIDTSCPSIRLLRE